MQVAYGYSGRQEAIGALAELVRRPADDTVEMRDLPPRVDAGVGSPSTVHNDGFVGNLAKGRFEGRLDGFLARLPLPSRKRCAVILDDKGVSGQRGISLKAA